MRAKSGFTLIELLVVIIIIAILAALLLPALVKALCSGRQGAAEHLISQLSQAAKAYDLDQNTYPPDDASYSSEPLARALNEKGSRNLQYFEFLPGTRTDVSGENTGPILNPVWASLKGSVIANLFYARNFPPGDVGKNKSSFDIWGYNCNFNASGSHPAPTRDHPADELVTNWE